MRPRIESSDRHERIVNSRDVLGIHGPERDGIGFGISDHYVTGKSNHVTGKDNHSWDRTFTLLLNIPCRSIVIRMSDSTEA